VATAEKTIILLRGERETLTRKLEKAEKDRDSQKATLAEREGIIQQLRAEGEALSQKHGDSVQQVRKLRASLREVEAVRDELGVKLAAADANAEARLLRNESLAEGEREKQIDLESVIREQAAEMQSLHHRCTNAESRAAEREEALRAEVVQLQRTCSTLQAARDEQAANHVDAALPLMRQVEDMQRASRVAAEAATDSMSRLQARLREAEVAAVAAESAERAAKSRAVAAEEALGDKSLRLTALTKEVADLSLRCAF
jgi:chromosome segregation protein